MAGSDTVESEPMLNGQYKTHDYDKRLSWWRPLEVVSELASRAPRRLVQVLLGALIVSMLAIGASRFVKPDTIQLDHIDWLRSLSLEEWKSDRRKGDNDVRKAVVIASYAHQDVTWLQQLNSSLTSGWEIYRYVNDVTAANATGDMIALGHPDGREGLAYITYILDHYDDLPDVVVFIHGHEKAWHQPVSMADRLAALSLPVVQDEGYVSLQCMGGGCSPDQLFHFNETSSLNPVLGMKLEDFWDDMMLTHGFGHLPRTVGRQCCAQFAVSKEAILQHDLQFWKDFQDPLLGYDHEKPKWHSPIIPGFTPQPGHRVGLYFEMIWHIIFGKDHVHCPTNEWCEEVAFQDLIHCSRVVTGWGDKTGWENITCTNDLRKDALKSEDWTGSVVSAPPDWQELMESARADLFSSGGVA